MECGAILDVIRLLDVLPDTEITRAKQLLVRIVGMLSRTCDRLTGIGPSGYAAAPVRGNRSR